jgi:hypothetical protein
VGEGAKRVTTVEVMGQANLSWIQTELDARLM